MPGRSPCAPFPGAKAGLAAFLLLAASPLPAVEVITVYGYRLPDFTVAEHPSDSAAFIAAAPGGAVNRNGPLSGIPQYRGLHTYRVRTHVDGRQPHTAGPVWMDSPLHYLPSALVDRLEVYRGIAPVRVGPSIGGHIEAVSHTSRYQADPDYEFGARVTLDGHSVDDGGNASVFLSLANDAGRYHVYGVHDEGDDMESGDGRVAGTEYERDYFGFGFGRRWGDGAELSFDYARNNTGDAGTPALPMDIGHYHTDLLNLRLRAPLGAWRLRAQAHYQDTAHWMSNYHLRPAPDFSMAPLPPFQGTDRRHAAVDGESWGGKLQLERPAAGGTLRLGADLRRSENDAVVRDPDFAPFFVDNFRDAVTRERGAFAEWEGALAAAWRGEFGLRLQHTRTSSGRVGHFRPPACADGDPATACPAPARSVGALSARLNGADRSRGDAEWDAVAVLTWAAAEDWDLEFGLARKTRAPAYLERYLWAPLETNGGLGDGNNYVGDPALAPEVSWQAELGALWRDGGRSFAPRLFYRRVDDYIAGVPAAGEHVRRVSGALNGDPTPMRFANADAEFYGADLRFALPLSLRWTLDGTASWVRGRLREDRPSLDGTRSLRKPDLDRMPPLRGRLNAHRAADRWTLTLAAEFSARQSEPSLLATDDPQSPRNRAEKTPGYVLLHAYARWDLPARGLILVAGAENLADRAYADPMSGFNRVPGGGAPFGRRLPGAGRNGFVKLVWEN